MFKCKHLLDFSDYPKDSKFFDQSNKNIDGEESNTAKGVNIATEFNEFKGTLFNKKIIRHKMKRMQSKKHKIETYEISKISLLYFDDKRSVLDDGIHALIIFIKT